VGITRASHTSVVLLKVLLKNYYKLDPVYVPTGPRPGLKDIDAALVIGNDAMVRTPDLAAYTYDLGDLWLRKTGFPVVFAVFAVRERIVETYESEIKAVISSYRSPCCLNEEKACHPEGEQRYPDIIYGHRQLLRSFGIYLPKSEKGDVLLFGCRGTGSSEGERLKYLTLLIECEGILKDKIYNGKDTPEEAWNSFWDIIDLENSGRERKMASQRRKRGFIIDRSTTLPTSVVHVHSGHSMHGQTWSHRMN
jgi:hypothetical protein